MTVYNDLVTVGTAGGEATRGTICSCPSTDTFQQFYVHNYGANLLLIGGPTVGTSGYPLPTGGTLGFTLQSGEAVYGVSAAGTCEVRIVGFTGSR